MEIVERYLQAVRFWLPKLQEQDIIAELSEEIRCQIEDQEAGLGRTLREEELAGILRRIGRPVLVANRYLPQQQLIGPVLFPIYRFALKLVAIFYLLPWTLVNAGLLVFEPAYRANPEAGLAAAVGKLGLELWMSAFWWFGGVTLLFAALERAHAKSRFLENWDPRKLQPVRNHMRIPRANSAVEIGANAAFALWWATVQAPVWIGNSGVMVRLAPAGEALYWGFLILAIANIVLAAFKLVRPYWTPARASLQLLSDGAGTALFCWLCKVEFLAEVRVGNLAPEKTQAMLEAIHQALSHVFPFALLVGAVIFAVNFNRLLRTRAGGSAAVRPAAVA